MSLSINSRSFEGYAVWVKPKIGYSSDFEKVFQ